ncbi:hypothetical protein LTR22_027788 [Elasticomyces elasticus]|nr:hypothetical protein LTR22_027788 [Elasticomyces elasticus]
MKGTSIDRTAALEACLTATVYELVFEKQLPWDGPQEILAVIGKDVPMMNQVLDRLGCQKTTEYVVWQTARSKLDGDEFPDAELRPIADQLAMLMLDCQLYELGARNRVNIGQLASLIFDALLLKGKMRAAPDYYEVTWAKSGEEFVRANDEEIQGGQGRQEILWYVSPRVRVRGTKDGEWLVCARAKVFTKPWVEDRE